jgi:hypothetical protein
MNESESTLTENLPTQGEPQPPKQRSLKLSAEKALPLSGADTLVKIIKGYAIASNGGQTQINYKDVASAAGISPTVVSGNNRFLLESQILISPKFGYYIPSEGAVRFAREAAWDEPAAKAHLRQIVIDSWYGQVAVQNFTLRPALRREELKRALAIKSGATEGDSNALESLTDFLIYIGIVVEGENGLLVKGDFDAEAGLPQTSTDASRTSSGASEPSEITVAQGPPHKISLTIHIHIRDLSELTPESAARLKDWLELVNKDDAEVQITNEPANEQSAENVADGAVDIASIEEKTARLT